MPGTESVSNFPMSNKVMDLREEPTTAILLDKYNYYLYTHR